MKKNILYIFGLILFISFSACKGGGDSPSPETLESKLNNGNFTIQSATQNGTDVKSTFLLQSFTTPADKTSNLSFYPSGGATGNWATTSETDFNLSYSDGTNDYTLQFRNVSLEGNTLIGTVNIPANAGGKSTAVEVVVEYSK